MKILFIQPKMSKRPMDTYLKTRMSPSLAIYTLIALTPGKHEVIVINENIEKIDYNLDVDLVAITVTVDVFSQAIQIHQNLKAEEFLRLQVAFISALVRKSL